MLCQRICPHEMRRDTVDMMCIYILSNKLRRPRTRASTKIVDELQLDVMHTPDKRTPTIIRRKGKKNQ